MKKNTVWILLVAGVAAGLYWWNNQRIESLKIQLEAARANPPKPTETQKWLGILSILYNLGLDIYKEFQPGGSFAKSGLSKEQLDSLVAQLSTFRVY
ncbi:MAG TPA: hypothetical protein PK006_12400 [Saprospiraceae bacterium]|nr:hypothetical protein [Saprospiraceae bacterium]